MTDTDVALLPHTEQQEISPGDAAGENTLPATRSDADERSPLARLITIGTVLACAIYTAMQLHPRLLLKNTTTAGGDMGAHVWGPAYLRDHLLPHGRLTGWSPDWYGGFPAYQFYMVLPALAVVVLDLLMPYNVAFKLVTVSGVILLPVAAAVLGRLARLRFPGPALLAVASMMFLFDKSFTIYGGNIASTLAGEFAFSIALTLCLVYFGVVIRGLETGRHRAFGAVLLAGVALCHPLVGIMAFLPLGTVAIAAVYVWRSPRTGLWWLACTTTLGLALSAFWVLPFIVRRPYLNDMGWERLTTLWASLAPHASVAAKDDTMFRWTWYVIYALVLVAVVLGAIYRERLVAVLSLTALLLAMEFLWVPQGRLWNARVLPFYYLCLYLLAGLGVALVARFMFPLASWRTAVLVPAIGIVAVLVGLPLGALPGAKPASDGGWNWYGYHAKSSFVGSWANWNYSGYEGKAAYPEYSQLISAMGRLGRDRGCGRAMWEYDTDRLNGYGTPMALMLLPQWTDGCIGSMEGLFFEASTTTPFHFLNQSELSARPSRPQRKLPYNNLDVTLGVRHLQLLGVRYYMAFSEGAVSQARANPNLVELDEVGGDANRAADLRRSEKPDQAQIDRSLPWVIFEVKNSALVEPLGNEPVVLTNTTEHQSDWLQLAVQQYADPNRWDVLPAATGPSGTGAWSRVAVEDPKAGYVPADKNRLADQPVLPELPRKPLAAVQVSNIVEKDSSLSFTVDQIGVPVLVKTSYFPNWKVQGGQGPYRVMPNLMVVIPTQQTVHLHYGYTPVDLVAYALTGLAAVGALILWRRRPLAVRGIAVPDAPIDPDAQFWASLAEDHRSESGTWAGGGFELSSLAPTEEFREPVLVKADEVPTVAQVLEPPHLTAPGEPNSMVIAAPATVYGLAGGSEPVTSAWFDAKTGLPAPDLLGFKDSAPVLLSGAANQITWVDRERLSTSPPPDDLTHGPINIVS